MKEKETEHKVLGSYKCEHSNTKQCIFNPAFINWSNSKTTMLSYASMWKKKKKNMKWMLKQKQAPESSNLQLASNS